MTFNQSYRVLVFVIACLVSQAHAQLTPTSTPTTPRELAELRAYHDGTTWAAEIEAQKYENTVASIWDQLISQDHAWSAFADLPVKEVLLNGSSRERPIENGITRIRFDGLSKTYDQQSFREMLQRFEMDGFQITGSEWKLIDFSPAQSSLTESEPANSTVSMLVHAKQESSSQRFVLNGKLQITWSGTPDAESKRYAAESVKVTDLEVLVREGEPVFSPAMSLTLDIDPNAKDAPMAVDPIVIQDLNGDHLPEVILVGANRVYWNRGKWRFAKKALCRVASLRVIAAQFADFDQDGALDLLCSVRGGPPLLYRGTKNGQFLDRPTAIKIPANRLSKPSAITTGDIDGDGDVDVFLSQTREGHLSGGVPTPYFDANDSFPSMLLQNDGKGNFTDITEQSGLKPKSQRRVRTASLVDFDQDTDLDLLLTSDFNGTELLVNDGQGKFTDETDALVPAAKALGMGHALADFNLDGKLDFLTIGVSSAVARRLDAMQLGREDFSDYTQMRTAMRSGNRLYLNESVDGMVGFAEAKPSKEIIRSDWPWSATALDYDRDGDPDVFTTNGQISGKSARDYDARFWCHDIYFRKEDRPTPIIRFFAMRMRPAIGKVISWHGFEHNALLSNLQGDGFIDTGYLMGCASVKDSRSAISGDLDLDGRVDLIYSHVDVAGVNEINLEFLRNRSQDENHWIGIHLTPNAVVRNTHGTQVTVQYNDRTVTAHHTSGDVYGSQHSNTVHFGLGAASSVKSLEIKWPNGGVTKLDSPEIDRYHVATPTAD